jgi:hypothetical protein
MNYGAFKTNPKENFFVNRPTVRRLSFITALLSLLLAAGAFSPNALAQSDTSLLATLTPYTFTEPAFEKATCSGEVCRMSFPAVPAGKRLLITSVSLNTFSQSTDLSAVLTDGVLDYGAATYRQTNLPNGLLAKTDLSGFGYTKTWAGITNFYVEAGYSPTFVFNGEVLTNEFAGQATITGILIPTK